MTINFIGKTTGNTLEKVTLTAGNNITVMAGTLTIESQNTTYNAATTEVEGLMSSSDKTKLDGIQTGADVTDNQMLLLEHLWILKLRI